MGRHGTPQDMRELTSFLQKQGLLTKKPGAVVSRGCVVDTVPYPLRVTASKAAGRWVPRTPEERQAWIDSLEYGTVRGVDKDVVLVLWDSTPDWPQVLAAEELLLRHQMSSGLPILLGPGTEWWRGIDLDELVAANNPPAEAGGSPAHACPLPVGGPPNGLSKCPECGQQWRLEHDETGWRWKRYGDASAG